MEFDSVIDSKAKEIYWRVVKDCLVQIHGLKLEEARARASELRERVESPPEGISSDLFYHDEPFYVACDLAENQLEVDAFAGVYDRIRAQYYPHRDSA